MCTQAQFMDPHGYADPNVMSCMGQPPMGMYGQVIMNECCEQLEQMATQPAEGLSHEDLMRTLIPGGSAVDRAQLAEQLRAAAAVCYED